jgi:hypothetical protein
LALTTIKHQNNSIVGKIGLLKTRPIHHHETNQHSGNPIQVSKFHEDSPHVSCFIIGTHHVTTIPRRTHEPLPPIIIDGEQKYEVEKFLDSKISHC